MFSGKRTGLLSGVAFGIGVVVINILIVGSGCFNCGFIGVDYCGDTLQCLYIKDSPLIALLHIPYLIVTIFTIQVPLPNDVISIHTSRLIFFALVFIPFCALIGHWMQKLIGRLVFTLKR